MLAWLGLRLNAPRSGCFACLLAFGCVGAMVASRPAPQDPHQITRVLEREAASLDDPIRLRGWVRVPPEDIGEADRFILETETVFAGVPARGGVRVTVYRPPLGKPLQLAYGRQVEFLARLRHPRNFRNPGGFDWVRYLQRRQIYMTASVRAGVPILASEGPGPQRKGSTWSSWLWRWRLAARDRLTVMLSQAGETEAPAAPLLWAMLLGERNRLDVDTETDFRRTGAYHTLVISGLHVGILAFVVLGLLRALAVPPIPRTVVAVAMVVAYALLVGATIPVSRAAWMLTAYLMTTLVYRQRRALNVIAATAFGFLVVDPELLFDVGFQMSFLAVGLIAGIAVPLLAVTVDPYRRALTDLWNVDRDLHLPPGVAAHRVVLRSRLEPLITVSGLPRRLLTGVTVGMLRMVVWAAALAVVSFVVQVGLTLPMAAHFNRISWGGVSSNLFVMPLLMVLIPAGLFALATGWPWAAWMATKAAGIITAVVEWHAENLPVDLRTPPPPSWLGLLFGVSLVLVALSWGRGLRWRWLSGGGLLVSLLLVAWHPFRHDYTAGQLEISALDVGQGESLFLALPDSRTMLIDGGGLPDYGGAIRRTFDIGESVVSPYLWSRSVRRLNVVAVTHPDADHFAGIPAIIENFAPEEFWLAAEGVEEKSLALIEKLERRGVRIVLLRQGDNRLLGGVRFEVLGPAGANSANWSRNDRSLVLRAQYGRQRFLLTGDIERQGEAHLVATDVRPGDAVLKVAHHGSRTSTHEPFLERVLPAFAIISAGPGNTFGHPHSDVLQRLSGHRVHVLRTDREGLVSVATDGWRLLVSTYRRDRLGEAVEGRSSRLRQFVENRHP